ncbi:hypothetical protein PXZ69_01505 [Acinetobacter baumannii]|uniref:hypothetical protein n=2 Tax=Acinetobacter TaxID=469 RepID=UPI002F406D46
MAVPEQTPFIEYTANGTTTVYPLTFDCDKSEYLIVSLDGEEAPVGSWSLAGGSITFNSAPANGVLITIERNTPFQRTTDYQSYNNSFRPAPVNKDFDLIWWKLQELGVADWILGNRISALKNYVDRKDDELKAYLMEEIRKQGVALDQLDEYYNYLMQQLAQVAIDRGWAASFIVSADGSTQQEINDRIGNTWYAKPLGYELNARVMLENGDIVKNTIIGNTNDPNLDMTGWVNDYDVLDQKSMYANYGIVPVEPLKIYVERLPIQAILKTDGTDETVKFKAYIAAAKTLGKPLVLPKGTIYISDTVDIDFRLELSGAGRDQTYIRFKNTIANKRMFVFKRGSGMSDWRNFTLLDNKHGTSEGIVFTDSRTDVGGGVWKCLFTLIEIRGFAVSHRYTSNNPLDGGSHAHCSEMLWQQCRFSNNKITAIVENCQAVNNMYVKCDGENFDTAYLDENIVDANWPFFIDYAGGGINIIGGSWIGRGKLFSWLYPAGGTGLFSGSGAFKGQDIRFELRPTYNGVLIEEGIHGNAGTSMHMSIEVTNLKTLNYGATVDLFRFAGRCKAVFKNCEPVFGAGRLVVRQYPTLGRSSNTTIGAMADVLIENCGTTFYEKETSSPYGPYDRAASANVVIKNNHPASTNQSYSTDAQGFRVVNSGGDIQQLGQSFNSALSPSRLAFNNDNPSSGFANATQHKFCIPKYGRPLKAFMYKMAVRHAVETSIDLYLVKDVAQWAGSTFDVGTDAVLVASGPLTVNKSGYFEVPINLTSNIVGNAFQSGFDSWLEGRMMFVIKGGNTFSGFFGVEYI